MRKIGIIGGIGPESTLDYYRGIIAAVRERSKGEYYPEIIVYSGDLGEGWRSWRPGTWTGSRRGS